ncbi:MAG: hypothetical protein R6V59_07010 [Dehalococcoidia bacterium]
MLLLRWTERRIVRLTSPDPVGGQAIAGPFQQCLESQASAGVFRDKRPQAAPDPVENARPDEPGGKGRCSSGQAPEFDINHRFDI